MRFVTDGTQAGSRLVDEETGEEISFIIRPASGDGLRPGASECLLVAVFALEADEARRASFEVIRGGSSA